jgi:hypothetical protein
MDIKLQHIEALVVFKNQKSEDQSKKTKSLVRFKKTFRKKWFQCIVHGKNVLEL